MDAKSYAVSKSMGSNGQEEKVCTIWQPPLSPCEAGNLGHHSSMSIMALRTDAPMELVPCLISKAPFGHE